MGNFDIDYFVPLLALCLCLSGRQLKLHMKWQNSWGASLDLVAHFLQAIFISEMRAFIYCPEVSLEGVFCFVRTLSSLIFLVNSPTLRTLFFLPLYHITSTCQVPMKFTLSHLKSVLTCHLGAYAIKYTRQFATVTPSRQTSPSIETVAFFLDRH